MELIKINEVEINFSKEGEMVFIPIKPICEVLGIDHSSQVSTLKNHPVLGSALVKKRSASRDNKQYEMATLPIKYFFGWLFSIDSRKVNPEAAEQVIKCQEQIYDIMYEKFFLEPLQQKRKLIMLLEEENRLLGLENDRKELNAQIKAIKQNLEEIKALDADHFSKSIIE
jgi:hypothetical protein